MRPIPGDQRSISGRTHHRKTLSRSHRIGYYSGRRVGFNYWQVLEPFKSLLATAFQTRVGFPGLQIAEQLRHELCWQDDLTPLAVESLCLELLVAASRAQRVSHGPAPAWLLRTVDYAHAQFLERPSLRELGKIAGVSPEHFNREFRRLYRVNAAQYIRRLRLEWAAERLRNDEESLAEIASAAGFADQSHFTRWFKRQFGITPAAYRAASRIRPQ